MKIHLVYITARDADESRSLGRYLVEARLVACVNIFESINSLYLWEGNLQDERESVLVVKTTADKVSAVIEAVKARHSYDCPCVVSLPIEDGNSAFIDWIVAQVK